MTQEAEKLKLELDLLPQEDRAQIATYLIRTLDQCDTAELTDDEFEDELRRRSADIESGRDPGEPAEDVMREIREKYL